VQLQHEGTWWQNQVIIASARTRLGQPLPRA
jgi:hypothetical protein